jgi:PadR family transcriptional regulator, regulatory protein PadR
MHIERELMRGAGPVAVLKCLQRREMYGYELVEALSKRSDGVLKMGQSTLYPMLYNFEAKGLIKSRTAQADSGRTRRYYALTAKGKKRLAADAKQWQAAIKAMQALGIAPGGAG